MPGCARPSAAVLTSPPIRELGKSFGRSHQGWLGRSHQGRGAGAAVLPRWRGCGVGGSGGSYGVARLGRGAGGRGCGGQPRRFTITLIAALAAGLIWQFVLVMLIVAREQHSLRWAALRRALWLAPSLRRLRTRWPGVLRADRPIMATGQEGRRGTPGVVVLRYRVVG